MKLGAYQAEKVEKEEDEGAAEVPREKDGLFLGLGQEQRSPGGGGLRSRAGAVHAHIASQQQRLATARSGLHDLVAREGRLPSGTDEECWEGQLQRNQLPILEQLGPCLQLRRLEKDR